MPLFVGEEAWDGLMEEFCSRKSSSFSRFLTQWAGVSHAPFLPDLANWKRLRNIEKDQRAFPTEVIALRSILRSNCSGFRGSIYLLWESEAQKKHPLPGNDLALLWRHPKGDDLRVKSASSEDFLP